MKYLFIILLLSILTNFCSAQERNLPIYSLSHITIDSVVMYDDPFKVTNGELENKGYSPVWLNAFCATAVPTFFDRDAKKALLYIHKSFNLDEAALQSFYDNWVPNPILDIDITIYILGDIYFHDNINNERYIYTPMWGTRYDLPVRLSALDTAFLGTPNKSQLDSIDVFFPFYRNDHKAWFFYILENGVYKKCKDLLLYDVLKWNMKDFSIQSSAKELIEIIYSQKNYARSRLENGHRVFETVMNTPKGPVVVKPKSNELPID